MLQMHLMGCVTQLGSGQLEKAYSEPLKDRQKLTKQTAKKLAYAKTLQQEGTCKCDFWMGTEIGAAFKSQIPNILSK